MGRRRHGDSVVLFSVHQKHTTWLHAPAVPSERVTLTRKPYVLSGVRLPSVVFDLGVEGRLTNVLPPSAVDCQLKNVFFWLRPARAAA
jgi:hypothetical protein